MNTLPLTVDGSVLLLVSDVITASNLHPGTVLH